jgi:hypothetical protein
MCLASDCGAFPRANGLGFDLGSGQCHPLIQLRVIGNFTLHAFTFGYKEFSISWISDISRSSRSIECDVNRASEDLVGSVSSSI